MGRWGEHETKTKRYASQWASQEGGALTELKTDLLSQAKKLSHKSLAQNRKTVFQAGILWSVSQLHCRYLWSESPTPIKLPPVYYRWPRGAPGSQDREELQADVIYRSVYPRPGLWSHTLLLPFTKLTPWSLTKLKCLILCVKADKSANLGFCSITGSPNQCFSTRSSGTPSQSTFLPPPPPCQTVPQDRFEKHWSKSRLIF